MILAMAATNKVARIRVAVMRDGERWTLMSRKRVRDPEDPRNQRLEFLGGRVDTSDPSIFEGLLRELREEETSHTLARLVEHAAPSPQRIDVEGRPHYLYAIEISTADEQQLTHCEKESWGFELIRKRDLELTAQTLKILQALDAENGDTRT